MLAFIVCLPIAGLIGFAAGRATADIGVVAHVPAPGGKSHVRVVRKFSLGPVDQRVLMGHGSERIELKRLDDATGAAGEIMWAPDGSLAGVLLNGSRLIVIDAGADRVLYELPLLETQDGSRMARGIGFSANAMAITFDDCPRTGAGCRSRFMALPTR
ncbi:MAG: hypothetical protein WD690_09880 [Vicinamibacterales bacterium]